jgi:hypothetical protein
MDYPLGRQCGCWRIVSIPLPPCWKGGQVQPPLAPKRAVFADDALRVGKALGSV